MPPHYWNAEADERLAKDFTYHRPKPELLQAERYESLRRKAAELARMFFQECPPSRERSLALTKLEESVMWANASIARNE